MTYKQLKEARNQAEHLLKTETEEKIREILPVAYNQWKSEAEAAFGQGQTYFQVQGGWQIIGYLIHTFLGRTTLIPEMRRELQAMYPELRLKIIFEEDGEYNLQYSVKTWVLPPKSDWWGCFRFWFQHQFGSQQGF